MDAKDKLIVALDVENADQALKLFDSLHESVGMFKIGMQLFTAAGPDIVRQIVSRGGRVFLDLKYHDIPNTVAMAAIEATRLGVTLFNIHASGGSEMMNIDVVKAILDTLGKSHSLISFVSDRLGHDRRYAIDSSFAQRELNWKPRRNFREGLAETIQWYIDNPSWWQPLLERAGRY